MKKMLKENLKSLKRNISFVIVTSLATAFVAVGVVFGLAGVAL